MEKRPLEDVISDLKEAGLGSVPGAGAEILVERVRKLIAPQKDHHRSLARGPPTGA